MNALVPLPWRVGDPVPFTPEGMIAWPEPDPESPFYLRGPALISFSGGRTSALMLFLILWAHGGKLPADVFVCFANTGKEREETLRFVYECGVRWGVKIHWLEWRPPPKRRKKGDPKTPRRSPAEVAALYFEEVGFNSADRTGKWFEELIRRKQYLPNVTMRYCTTELKVCVMKNFMIAGGFTKWINLVGLRADEPHRVMKQVLANLSGHDRWVSSSPLFLAGVVKRLVILFWLGRNRDAKRLTHPLPLGFDLGLYDYEGNCDLCFLKGRGKKARIIRERPGVALWWAACELIAKSSAPAIENARFEKDESVDQLAAAVAAQPELADVTDDGRDYDSECGVSCIADQSTEPIDDDAISWLREEMVKTIKRQISLPVARRKPAPALRDLYAEAA